MQPQQEENFWQPTQNELTDPSASGVVTQSTVETLADAQASQAQPIAWRASEFIQHDKDGVWFLGVAAVAAVLLIIDAFLVKSWTFGVLIVVMALSTIVIARRPPRTISYVLSSDGISIDDKTYTFHDFRAFGVIQEGSFYSVRLIPNKRFMPMVSVFFPTEQGEQIVDLLGARLPMETIELDLIEKLVEKIRF